MSTCAQALHAMNVPHQVMRCECRHKSGKTLQCMMIWVLFLIKMQFLERWF